MDLYDEALALVAETLQRAKGCGLREPTAMNVATVDPDGRPSSRMVLLKGVDARGFVFFTDGESRKGRALAANAYAALCLYWEPIMEQLRVEGRVESVSEAEIDAYWESRHPESRLSASASLQSRPLESRERLAAEVAELTERIGDGPVPRPCRWTGYRVVPERIEFWKSGAHRLHERTCYCHDGERWTRSLLYP